MKKIFTFIIIALASAGSMFAATEQSWYNDVTSISDNGKYYIFSVGGNGFMKAGSTTVMTATKSNTPSLFTITKGTDGNVSSGGKYLKAFKVALGDTKSGPINDNNTDDGTTLIWTSMSSSSYWNIHGHYNYLKLGQRYAGLYYKDGKYDAEIPSGSSWGFSDQKDVHTDKEYQWYLVSEAQYTRHWAIYDYDAYKETLNIEQFKTTVYKEVYAELETAYNVTFNVKNAEHTPQVIADAKKAIEDAYAAAEAYPAKFNAAKKDFDDARTAAQAIDKKDVTEAIYTKLHAYDEVNYDVVNYSLETINAATQALKDATAAAAGLKDVYADALATINELEGLKDKGENADDLKKISDDITAAREALKKAETTEAIKAAVTAPALKKIDPVTFNTTTFDALQNVSSAASSAQGQTIHYTSADLTIVNAEMKALHKGTVKLTARTEGNDQYYPFERSAEITVNAIKTYGTASGSVCEGTKFAYEGEYYAAGEHTVTLKDRNRTGGDSIVTLTVSTRPVFNTTDGAAICPSELADFTWEGEHFTENELVKTKVLTSKLYDCDSTVTFTLTLNKTYTVTDEATICPAALPYTWEGEKFESAGQKTKTLKTVEGCDSTVTFTLHVNEAYEVSDSKSICPSELAEFTWEGEHFTENELVKTKTLKSVLGCDSVVTFTLTVLPTYNKTDEATICPSELAEFTWEGEHFTENELVKTKTLKTVEGCDSTVTFTLTVLPAYEKNDGKTIRSTELPYEWEGYTFNDAGVKTQTLKTVEGCDSVVTFTLTVLPVYTDVKDGAEICDNELADFTWEGEHFTMDELVKTKTLKTIHECDSVVTFTLTVNKTYRFEEEMEMYVGEKKTWRNNDLSTQPVSDKTEMNDAFLTINGCDSVYVLNLTVKALPTTYGEVTESVCKGEEFTFIDDTYEAGEYTITTKNHLGGDSIITLTVVELETYETKLNYTATYGETYNIGGQEVTAEAAGTYTLTDSLLTINGCDSVIIITVVVEKAAQTIEWTLDTTSIEVENTLRLKAQASSGLPVTYSTSDETLATIEGDVLTAKQAGELTITASQEGNENYLPAEDVEQPLLILVKTALAETEQDNIKAGKLIYNGHLYIIRGGQVYNAEGRLVK